MTFLLGLMRKYISLFTVFAYGAFAMPTVSITQIIDHPALNAVRDGVQKALLDAGYRENETIHYILGNAQGTLSLASQLIQAHRGHAPAVMVTISTPSTQAAIKVAKGQIPIVFSAITDPVSAGLNTVNVTGVTDLPPFDQQMTFIQKVLPKLKVLGFIYNPGEDNSVASLNHIATILKTLNIDVCLIPVNKTADIGQAVRAAVGRVDAFYVPNDNTVVSGFDAIAKISLSQKIPLFAADILLVEKGALGMVGVDYAAIGYQTGTMVKRLLKGEALTALPVENPTDYKLYLNTTVAEKLGISFDDAITQKAHKVF